MVGVVVADRLDVFRTRRAHTATFSIAVGATSALAAVLSDAAPTGIGVLDKLYIAGFAATVTFLAASARRWTWFVPAGAGAAIAGDKVALACAGLAIALGVWSVWSDRRTRTRAALVVGPGVIALLNSDLDAFHGASALITAVAVLPVVVSGYKLARRRVRRRVRQVALIAGGISALIGIGLAIGVLLVAQDLYKGIDLLDDGVVAAQDADDDATALTLGEASRHLDYAASTLDSWFVRPARALPVVGQNLNAVEQLSEDVGEVAEMSALAASQADLDALRFNQGHIDLSVIENMVEPTEDVNRALDRARQGVDEVESPWLVSTIRERIDETDTQLRENLPDLRNAIGALKIASGLLGGEGDRRYLVLFTTPVESRGRSGFPGNYAELVASNGQLSMPRFGRIRELDVEGVPAEQRTISGPTDYVSRYGRFGVTNSWRNITMSPDLPSIAAVASQLYPQSGGPPINGVMVVDPEGLAALMNWTGEITPDDVPGLQETLTPENTAQFLHYGQYVGFEENEDRVDFLEDVARLTFDRLTSQTSMPSPRLAVDILDPIVDGNHIQFFTYDQEEQSYFDSIGLSGRFLKFGRGPLALVTSNAGGNKIDYFLQRGMRLDASWNPATGTVTGKATVTLTNNATLDEIDYMIGNEADDEDALPRGTNRSFVSLYSQFDVLNARIDGQPLALQRELEVGSAVYSAFVDIPAGATVTLEYDISGTVPAGGWWLSLPPQPMVLDDIVEINITAEGDARFKAQGENLTREGRVVRWAGPLDRMVEIALSTNPDAAAGSG